MTREELSKKIRWATIIWIVSVVNPLITAPQLIQIWQTHETAGLSMIFLGVLFSVQVGFSIHGFFTRDRFIMGSNGLAAVMTLLTIISTIYFRGIV